MAVTLASFKAAFPEFDRGDSSIDTLIQAKLDGAAVVADVAVLVDSYDEYVMYRAADDLANSPYGRAMKLSTDGLSPYSRRLRELKRAAAVGIRAL